MSWCTEMRNGRFVDALAQKNAYISETRQQSISQTIPDLDGIRIVTYNVHFWKHTLDTWKSKSNNFDDVINVLNTIDADVVCLQEVTNRIEWRTAIEELGYEICEPIHKRTGTFNVILSRFDITLLDDKWFQNRPSISAHIKHIGTIENIHPDVNNLRFMQIDNTVKRLRDVHDDVFLCGDFNTTRDEFKNMDALTPSSTHAYTNWTGKEIDFIFHRTQLNIRSWVYYTTASDHLPLVMDLKK